MTLALLIFGVSYLVIVTERVHKTIVALLGGMLMIVCGVVTQEEAFFSPELGIDFNVIFLLVGMMVIINIVRDTGLFDLLAIWSAQQAGAEPFRLLALLALLTAGLSAMLDNVTTVLLMAPVTLSLTKRLGLNPIPFLVCEALASNIGGAATLVGDPPNIMIGSKAQLGYLDFLIALGPIVVLIMAVFLAAFWLLWGRRMTVASHLREQVLALRARDAIRDRTLLFRCLWLLGIVNLGFLVHRPLHLEPATIALLGATLFMLADYGRQTTGNAEELSYLADVEWKTIFFFIGLFILVGGLVKVGVVRAAAEQLTSSMQGNLVGTTLAVLWGSAILSSIVDNIPYVAAMNPLILDLARSLHPEIVDSSALMHHRDVLPLWWALALGACLGGNGTVIGASANVVIVDLARRAGYPISFWQFFKLGFPVMIGSVLLSSCYLWLIYLR